MDKETDKGIDNENKEWNTMSSSADTLFKVQGSYSAVQNLWFGSMLYYCVFKLKLTT